MPAPLERENDAGIPESDGARLARLEAEVAALRASLDSLLRTSHVPVVSAVEPELAPWPDPEHSPFPESHQDFPPPHLRTQRSARIARPSDGRRLEELIGRYGTLVLATLTVLVGVGTFLSWAVQRGLLGPNVRVALGLLAAIAVASAGLRFRLRGAREFGNALLALALAVMHVVAFSAGPMLNIVPSWVALLATAASSALLTEFALRHDEELLTAVGFGGAALAPFVVSSGSNNIAALAAYGVAVVVLSATALGDRPWKTAWAITVAAFIVYMLAILNAGTVDTGPRWMTSRLPVLFPLAVLFAVVPLVHARHRRALTRVAAAGCAVGSAACALELGRDTATVLLTVSAALTFGAAMRLMRPGALEVESMTGSQGRGPGGAAAAAILDGAVLPLALLGAALLSAPAFPSFHATALAGLWAGLALFATHDLRGDRQSEPYAFTAAIALLALPSAITAAAPGRVAIAAAVAAFIIALDVRMRRRAFPPAVVAALIATAAFTPHPNRVPVLVAIALALTLVDIRGHRKPYGPAAVLNVSAASLYAAMELTERIAYLYQPFATLPSLLAALAVLGWAGIAVLYMREPAIPDPKLRLMLVAVSQAGALVTAFIWWRQELAYAWSPAAASALLIVYYGIAGVAAIAAGRRTEAQWLRVAGLGLTVAAAGKVLINAAQMPNIAVRVGLFFVVSAFLIAVAYWYRRGGSIARDTEDTEDTEEIAADRRGTVNA